MESNIKETERVQEQALRHLFRNNSDCYADTWHMDNSVEPHRFTEGKVVMAMTEDKFIELLTKASQSANKNNLLGIGDVSVMAEHHCGNQLTEKELFHDHCLKCGEYISED